MAKSTKKRAGAVVGQKKVSKDRTAQGQSNFKILNKLSENK
jgi:hypothetical protein